MKTKVIKVSAIIRGDRVILLDRSGRKIRTVSLERVSGAMNRRESARRYAWRRKCISLSHVGNAAARKSSPDPWSKKADSLRVSWNKRHKGVRRGTDHREKSVQTWEQCSKRLLQQHLKRLSRIDVTSEASWAAWANNKASNSRKVQRKMGSRIKAGDILALVESQDYRCAISGMKLTPATASLDHKQPVSRGGTHTIENAQIVHYQVNQAKGTMTMDEFVAMCMRVVQWNEARTATEDNADHIPTPRCQGTSRLF